MRSSFCYMSYRGQLMKSKNDMEKKEIMTRPLAAQFPLTCCFDKLVMKPEGHQGFWKGSAKELEQMSWFQLNRGTLISHTNGSALSLELHYVYIHCIVTPSDFLRTREMGRDRLKFYTGINQFVCRKQCSINNKWDLNDVPSSFLAHFHSFWDQNKWTTMKANLCNMVQTTSYNLITAMGAGHGISSLPILVM